MLVAMGAGMKIWITLSVSILLQLLLLRPIATCKIDVWLKVKSNKLAWWIRQEISRGQVIL